MQRMSFKEWANATMYHVAPSALRQSILNHGIDYKIHFQGIARPPNTTKITYAPRGNYLDESLESATQYGKESHPEGYDVWEVNVAGLKLFKDETWYKGWYCKAKIDPSRLHLVKTNLK